MKTTNFKLSEEQEKDLIKYATDRVEQLKVDNNPLIDVYNGGCIF